MLFSLNVIYDEAKKWTLEVHHYKFDFANVFAKVVIP